MGTFHLACWSGLWSSPCHGSDPTSTTCSSVFTYPCMWPIWASCYGTRRISRTLCHISGQSLPYDSPRFSCGHSTSDIHSAYSVTSPQAGTPPERNLQEGSRGRPFFGPDRLPVEDKTACLDDPTLTYTLSDSYTKKGFRHFTISANSDKLVDAAYLNSHWAV